MHGGVDVVGRALGVAVVECDEPFHLLAGIADEAGADLDLIREVTFTPEELKSLEEKSTQQIEISEFVPASKIDPVYYDKAYFLGPDKGGAKPFTTVQQSFGQVAVEAEVENVQHFAVQTPYVAAVVKGTRFTVTSDAKGASVSVQRGHVEVDDKANKTHVTISIGQSARTGVARLLSGDVPFYKREHRMVRADGSIVSVLIDMTLVRAADGDPSYYFVQVRDITDRKRAEEALAHQALHDDLTRLPNRLLLVDRLAHSLARAERTDSHVAVPVDLQPVGRPSA